MSSEVLVSLVIISNALWAVLWVVLSFRLARDTARWERAATKDNVKELIVGANAELFSGWDQRVGKLESGWEEFLDKDHRQQGRITRERQLLDKRKEELAELEGLSQGTNVNAPQPGEDKDAARWRLFNQLRGSRGA